MASRRGFLRLSRVLPTLCKHGNHFTCLQCGLEVGWAEIIRQTVSFLLVCVCVCGVEGGLGGHNQASNIPLAAKYW